MVNRPRCTKLSTLRWSSSYKQNCKLQMLKVIILWLFFLKMFNRGGVENTRLEAKDTKKIRGQGQGEPFRGQTLSRPRTGMLEANAKDQGDSRKCSPKKCLQEVFQAISNFLAQPEFLIGGAQTTNHMQ